MFSYFTEILEYVILSMTYYAWSCVPWHVKTVLGLVSIFATWWLCKNVYWFINLMIEKVGEFRRDVQWTAAQVRRGAVWMNRTVCQLYWHMLDEAVDRRMMQERPNRFSLPPSARGVTPPARGVRIIRSRSRPRVQQATPRRLRFGLQN